MMLYCVLLLTTLEVKMTQAQTYADQAVYQLQLRSQDAIRYISKNASVDTKTAEQAFRSVIMFHRAK